MSRIILDAGALIAFERGDVHMRSRVVAAQREKVGLVTTSPVVGRATIIGV